MATSQEVKSHPKVEECFKEAKNKLNSASHLLTITYPLVQDQKMFSRVLELLSESLVAGVNAALFYAHYSESLPLLKKFDLDYPNFVKKKEEYGLSMEEIKAIGEIMFIAKKLKEASMEFPRQDSLVILSETLETEQIDEKRLRSFLSITNRVLSKIRAKIEV
ncbi:MAG TPA: hypothetical protein HA282_04565 [Nanoarchaeota archaeon]|nr:hypothetical protein [Candidatus Pacearchaeota archaeon]HIH17756.1 hypothetical protein [Nanoarchaeota archaeon]HIH33781.1 hypothetical protein [Nanoarchaeota archaeon]HIH50807.1 hypothetical protein [Nanoarchaeota archaeon]HIH66457.1 hypothetical protein [Nanoarchaeota archaeon]